MVIHSVQESERDRGHEIQVIFFPLFFFPPMNFRLVSALAGAPRGGPRLRLQEMFLPLASLALPSLVHSLVIATEPIDLL